MQHKNLMKAKAWLFTLLIGMIGLVGFGQTTTDPAQNSAVIVTDYDVGEQTTVVTQTPVLVNAFTYQADGYQMEVKRYKQGNCEYLQFGKAETINTVKDRIITDVGWQNQNYNYNKQNTLIANSTNTIYRSPRDGLSML